MAGKFEWQFKYRDEADVNARPRRTRANFKKSLIAGISEIRQIRFTVRFSDNDNHRAQWRVDFEHSAARCRHPPRRVIQYCRDGNRPMQCHGGPDRPVGAGR